jgi:IS30 family transposase
MQRLTYYERQIIEAKLRQGRSIRAIARHLQRDYRVIGREVKRNKGECSPYTAATAERIAKQRECQRTRKKLGKDQMLLNYVMAEIRRGHSPEQIAGRLREQPTLSGLPGKHVCMETIYQYIYSSEGRWEHLYPHLRRGRYKRHHQRARKPQSGHIPERTSIHERPVEVKDKTRYGHWESDTAVCRKQKNALSVQYERKAQLARIHKVADRSAGETISAIRDTIASLPQDLFRTITFDNGLEAAEHTKLRYDYGLQTFFCDAYASWQKGGVENLNGLIRQYVPKDAPLDTMTDEAIYVIQEKLNNRPRKNLHYLTPNEVIAQEVGH